MTEDLSPSLLFQRALRGWWLLVIGMLLGGGIGFFVHLSRPPVYEGRATIYFSIDLARTGKITTAEEDIAIGAAGLALHLPPVPEKVIAAARARQLPLEQYPDWLKIFVERRNYQWIVRVRFTDAQVAAELANLWAEQGYAQLMEAQKHTEQAESLRRSMEGLESCLQNMAVVEPASTQCAWPSQAEVQRELQSLGQRHLQEKQASRGLIPALTFSMGEKALPNPQPVVYDRNTLILAGAILGLVISIILLSSGLVDRLLRVPKPAQD